PQRSGERDHLQHRDELREQHDCAGERCRGRDERHPERLVGGGLPGGERAIMDEMEVNLEPPEREYEKLLSILRRVGGWDMTRAQRMAEGFLLAENQAAIQDWDLA